MYCKNCGEKLDDMAGVCPKCGCPTDNFYASGNGGGKRPAADDAPSGGFSVLCFFFPIVGLILYLVWQDTYPLRAKSCGKGAIIGVVVEVVLGLLVGIIAGIATCATLASLPAVY